MQRALSGQRALSSLLLALVLAGLAGGGAAGRPIVPAEHRYEAYSGELPPCDAPEVLDRIRDRFQQKESEYWNSTLEIVSYDRIRRLALRPWGLDHIPRVFCMARAILNNRSYHEVSYNIGEDLGMIGNGFGVQWCVAGLDRNLAFAPNCQEARP